MEIERPSSPYNKISGNLPKKPGSQTEKSSVRVFIVEDEPTSIILTEAMLNQVGYQVVGVATSYEATVNALKVTPVDIVLVDLILSGSKGGLDVIRELNHLNIPNILITGTITDSTLTQLTDLEIYGFLPKPFDQLALATAIQLALKKNTRIQDRVFEEADMIKSRILAAKAMEEEFGSSEKIYLIKKRSHPPVASLISDTNYFWAVRIFVAVALLIAFGGILGYVFEIPFLVSYASHASTIKINALICTVLLSFSLLVENEPRQRKPLRVASISATVAVLFISGATLAQYLFNVDLGIDELLVEDRLANEFNIRGRMAGNTALGFVLLSMALIFNRFKKIRFGINLTEAFSLVSLFLALVGLLGHVFRQTEFNQVIPYLAQARPTLIAMTLLTAAVFCLNPRDGIMSILSNRRTSAKLGRKMLYSTNTLMLIVCLTIYYSTPNSFANLQVIFILIATLTMLTGVILWSTLKQIRNEIQSEQTVKLLQNRERELQFVLRRVPNPVAVLDKNMRYLLASRRWVEDFNLGDKSIIGRSHYEIFPQLPEQVRSLHQRAMNGEIINLAIEEITDSQGRKLSLKGEIRPWFDINDQVGGLIIFVETVHYQAGSLVPEKEL